ncbi:PP2C family protein-serine/threonine phosphatase [Mesobacillus selenatarsenatis]|uniref:Protein serine/threonine phosphatase PrpC, regulation of stationary phase n=1 Tax=Mesobacillus selenatarsenatis (strain DSM 18680 / JCM 14380 / FERM P-15431 / SF-1) TaxID=1321606 RepID=A0A0A8X0S7_MESS1|nr:protein phosphatase 2C domain-containing protein [Mesobacillus selenatarsenatis]GAM12637.1 protein serine/threonine phosphatase PrpC, regulation of stationary phase [Mesobacillus selenatarsenatis SF-1]
MTFQVAYHTDIGIKKKTNQDGLLLKTARTPEGEIGLFVICDGMGGLSHGELASATVIRGMSDWFENDLPEMLEAGIAESDIPGMLEKRIRELNNKIIDYGEASNIKLGTTITALLILHKQYYILQIGDSRAYSINDKLVKLTEDQTLVERELQRGNITAEQARIDPRRNVLLQCVGATKDINVVINSGEVESGTMYMLCTDGFYHEIRDEEMLANLNPQHFTEEKSMKKKLVELIELAKQRQETDNISILLAKRDTGRVLASQ